MSERVDRTPLPTPSAHPRQISNPTIPSKTEHKEGCWHDFKENIAHAGMMGFAPVVFMTTGAAGSAVTAAKLIKNFASLRKKNHTIQQLKNERVQFLKSVNPELVDLIKKGERLEKKLLAAQYKKESAETTSDSYTKINHDDPSKVPSWVVHSKQKATGEVAGINLQLNSIAHEINEKLNDDQKKNFSEINQRIQTALNSRQDIEADDRGTFSEFIDSTRDMILGTLLLPSEPIFLAFGSMLFARAMVLGAIDASIYGKEIATKEYEHIKTPLYKQTDDQIEAERARLAKAPHVDFSNDPKSITVTSWNMGMGDEHAWFSFQISDEQKKEIENDAQRIEDERQRAEFMGEKTQEIRKELFLQYFENNRSDVLILQEATDPNRLREWLKDQPYEVYVDSQGKVSDRVIVFNKERFTLVSEDKQKGKYPLVHYEVTLKDKLSGKEIVVVCDHASGFQEEDRDRDTATGNEQVQASRDKMRQRSGIVIYGADLNDSRRIGQLEADGFKTDDSRLPTRQKHNRITGETPYERIDYVAARGVSNVTPLNNDLSQIDASSSKNPSDHLPVSSRVKF